MRLIRRRHDGRFEFTRYLSEDDLSKYPYAILSHTWLLRNEQEVTYQDFTKGRQEDKPQGYAKIQFCADRAAADGLEYFWVDTCCINKANSEELYEAVTSMFSWYRRASRCYVYLSDVFAQSAGASEVYDGLSTHAWEPAFRGSRWFTRGWTLQELLAPSSVEFYSAEGIQLGDKSTLERCVYEITGIPRRALQGHDLSQFSFEERMKWSEDRDTKREEDKAYCLLGIFGIFIYHMYGEGEHNAFDRLRDEIAKKKAEAAHHDDIIAALSYAPGAAFDSHNNEHQPKCLPGTRVELLAEIDLWVNAYDQRCICWLKGIAGSGKSTIARTVAAHYEYRGELGASFFFSRDSGDLSSSTQFVTSLARQLAANLPSIKRYICKALAEQRSVSELSLREQWNRLILKPLFELKVKRRPFPLVFVIDALDECDNEKDVSNILGLLSTAKSLDNIRLRCFISSRPELPIHAGFQTISEVQRHTLVLDEETPVRVNRDIKLLLESYFDIIRKEHRLTDQWPEPSTVEALVGKSGGLFVWASTACRFIREDPLQSQGHLSMLLHGDRSDVDPNRKLDRIYSTILQSALSWRAITSEDLSEIMGTIVLLCSPLSLEALATLLHKPLEKVQIILGSLQSIFRLPAQPNAPIRLHHPTFRDYLLDKSRCTVPGIQIYCLEIHRRIADSCVDHMSRDLPLVSSKNRGAITPSLQYACLYWVEHYRTSRAQLHDGDRTHLFIEGSFHLWVQVMDLMGKGADTGTSLRIYQSLLTSALNERQLKMIVIARQRLVALQPAVRRYPGHGQMTIPISPPLSAESIEKLRPSSWHLGLHNAEASGTSWKDIKYDNNYANDVSFTPDGKQLASGSNNETIRLWQVDSMSTVLRLEDDFTEKVSSVCISPGGTRLAAGSDDSRLKIWDLRTRKVLNTLQPKAGWVNSVQFNPSGDVLASGSMDGTVVLWDTATGQRRTDFDHQGRCVNSMSFSPDGSYIVTGSDDGLVRLWTVRGIKVEPKTSLDVSSGQSVNSVKFSPDGAQVLFGSDDTTVTLWNISTGKQIAFRGHKEKVTTVSFCPKLGIIASGSEDMTIRIWDVSNGAQLRTLRDHDSGLNAITFSPDGRLLASSSLDDEIRLWDTATWISIPAPNDVGSNVDVEDRIEYEPPSRSLTTFRKDEQLPDIPLRDKHRTSAVLVRGASTQGTDEYNSQADGGATMSASDGFTNESNEPDDDTNTTYSMDDIADDIGLQHSIQFAHKLAEDVAKGGMGDVQSLEPSTLHESIRLFTRRLHEESDTPFRWETCVLLHRKQREIVSMLTTDYVPKDDGDVYSEDGQEEDGAPGRHRRFFMPLGEVSRWCDNVMDSDTVPVDPPEPYPEHGGVTQEDYKDFVCRSRAYVWLVTDLRRRFIAPESTEAAIKFGHQVCNRLRQELPLRKMSRQRPGGLVELTIELDWNPIEIAKAYGYQFPYSDILHELYRLVGTAERARIVSMSQYVIRNWPSTGGHLLVLLRDLMSRPEGIQSTYQQPGSGTVSTGVILTCNRTVFSFTAGPVVVSEFVEQLGWLYCALQVAPIGQGTMRCRPSMLEFSSNVATSTPNRIAVVASCRLQVIFEQTQISLALPASRRNHQTFRPFLIGGYPAFFEAHDALPAPDESIVSPDQWARCHDVRLWQLPKPLQIVAETVPTTSIKITAGNDCTLADQTKLFLEDHTGYVWDWWPLCSPRIIIEHETRRVEWMMHGHRLQLETPAPMAKLLSDILDSRAEHPFSCHCCCARPPRASWLQMSKTLLRHFIAQGLPWQGGSSLEDALSSVAQRYTPSGAVPLQPVSNRRSAAPTTILSGGTPCPVSGPNASTLQGSVNSGTVCPEQHRSFRILFAVQGSRWSLELEPIMMAHISCDSGFFRLLRSLHRTHRQVFLRWTSPFRFKICKFVKLDRVSINRVVSGCKQELPDDHGQTDAYEYTPRPPAVSAPLIDPRICGHLLSECEDPCRWAWLPVCMHDCVRLNTLNDWVTMIPKKKEEFNVLAQAGERMAFGIQADYALSLWILTAYHLAAILPTFAFWAFWLARHPSDWQNAVVPLMTVLAMITVFWFLASARLGNS